MSSRPFDIAIQTYRVGKDYVFHLTGGVAHIGAVATAYVENTEIKVGLTTVPGHREDELAVELATAACEAYKQTVTAIVGIHIDHATREEIQQMVEVARQTIRETIRGV
ncbi:hypothetical protein ACQCN2_13435 [Brevibacillus ginsengisoli]|uniref:prenylated flavin chaperone LpdD n=1 Tax=Brevibacillus ginsengisoli TaxID=363854 RepID=UPI003CF765DE